MKSIYVKDLKYLGVGTPVTLLGWLTARRRHGQAIFLDVSDSTGKIQVIMDKSIVPEADFEAAKRALVESSVRVDGHLQENPHTRDLEVKADSLSIISAATKQISPQLREDFDVFDPNLSDHLLAHRHLYLRHPKIAAIMRFRDSLLWEARRWFRDHRFVEITAPILTPVPLYEDNSALGLEINGEKVLLTQCVGYYLESAAHALERVYNIGPSFRGEESRSKRHLMEYWHIKAEATFGDLEDIIALVENIIAGLTHACRECGEETTKVLGTSYSTEGLNGPFPRLRYRDAISQLQAKGCDISFGKGLSSAEEDILSKNYTGPFWIMGIPRVVEPFPYVIDPDDPEVTRTADLIAPRGYGELLGVAEKIVGLPMLDERMAEKGKLGDARYEWIRDLRGFGPVPHIAFGMGVERLMRWLLNINHVRDAIPFPRTFRRSVYP